MKYKLLIGTKVRHGSPGYENEEIISRIIEKGDHLEVEFESGCFTLIKHKLDFFVDLLAFLKENPKASAMEILGWAFDIGDDPYVEKIDGSDEEMTPEENDIRHNSNAFESIIFVESL